jgi:hypothetical protein
MTQPDFADVNLLPTKNGLDFGVHYSLLSIKEFQDFVLSSRHKSARGIIVSNLTRIVETFKKGSECETVARQARGALDNLVERLTKARRFGDLVQLIKDEMPTDAVHMALSLPEEMNYQFSFTDAVYPGAEVCVEGRSLVVKVDIKYLLNDSGNDSDWSADDIAVLIRRQICHVILGCMRPYGLQNALHSYLLGEVGKITLLGTVRGFPYINWETVLMEAKLRT